MAVCVCLRAIQPKLQMAVRVSCYRGLPLCCHGTPQCDPPFKPAFHFHWACVRESLIICGASCRSLDREVQMVVVGMHLLQLDFKYLTLLSTYFMNQMQADHHLLHRSNSQTNKAKVWCMYSHISSVSSPVETSSANPGRWSLRRSCLSLSCFLSLCRCRLSLVHIGSWRLVCSKCCRRRAPTGAVCSPHLLQKKKKKKIGVVLAGDVGRGSCWYRDAEPRLAWRRKKKGATQLSGNYAQPADEEPRVKTQLMQGEEVSQGVCSLFSQLIPRPPSEKRDGLRWDGTGWESWGCHKVAPRSQRVSIIEGAICLQDDFSLIQHKTDVKVGIFSTSTVT